jgi:hypothetical protein
MLVVLGDGKHSLTRHVLSAKHVFEERQDVWRALGTAE